MADRKTSDLIRQMCKDREVYITELARRVNTTGQNLSNKLRRNNFTERELTDIAKALGCEYRPFFFDENGKRIE